MRPGDDTQPDRDRVTRDVALLAAYLLSSSRGLIEEPDDYGVLRCMDGARRALAVLVDGGLAEPELTSVHGALDEVLYAPMGSTSDLAGTLDTLCLRLASALR